MKPLEILLFIGQGHMQWPHFGMWHSILS